MAAADTIVVLDGIQFQKETTSDVYTQDHATNSSVYSNQFHIPLAYKAARVIYNGAYDPNGGRFHYRTKLLRTTSITTPTKTANQQDEWQTLTPPAVAESTAFDVSASWDSIIAVDICQSSTTANTTGVEIIVQGRKEDSLDEWVTIAKVNPLAYGAATKSDFAAQEAAGQTTLSITDPTTGNLDHLGKFIFLEDTATIAQCEIAFIVECGADS
jgi:hypothetical protein